jgi:predicted transposase YdaD
MAHGIKHNETSETDPTLLGWGRSLGLVLFGSLGIVVIAATALLPAYASYERARYELACEQARTEYLQRCIRVNERLQDAARNDPVFIERLLIAQGQMVRTDTVPFDDETSELTSPDILDVPPPVMPEKPDQALLVTAQRLSQPRTQRGLYLLGACLVLVAMVISAPPKPDDDAPSRLTV